MFKQIFALIGGALGLAAAYAQRPSLFGRRPTLTDMFTEPEFQGDLIIFAIVGVIVGVGIGAAIDHFKGNPKDKD